jgi:hypothetical protein
MYSQYVFFRNKYRRQVRGICTKSAYNSSAPLKSSNNIVKRAPNRFLRLFEVVAFNNVFSHSELFSEQDCNDTYACP